MRPRLSVLFSLMLLVPCGVWAQNDPVVGTWKQDLAKSKYSPGPPPKSAVVSKVAAVAGGVRVVTDNVNAEGQPTHTEYTAKFDGKYYPRQATVGGKPNTTTYDSVLLKKIDAYNYETTEKQRGQMFGFAHWTISQDGKTRTLTETGKNAQGQATSNTIVYDKQ